MEQTLPEGTSADALVKAPAAEYRCIAWRATCLVQPQNGMAKVPE
jgi:hypothetical protein